MENDILGVILYLIDCVYACACVCVCVCALPDYPALPGYLSQSSIRQEKELCVV
jgi:hypothetical protein